MRNEVSTGLGLAVALLPRCSDEAPAARGPVGLPCGPQLALAVGTAAVVGAGHLAAVARCAEPKKQAAGNTGGLTMGGGLEQSTPQAGPTPADVRPGTKAGSSTVGRGEDPWARRVRFFCWASIKASARAGGQLSREDGRGPRRRRERHRHRRRRERHRARRRSSSICVANWGSATWDTTSGDASALAVDFRRQRRLRDSEAGLQARGVLVRTRE